MFIGHYAAGFALKSVEKKASLGMLFIMTQLVDYLFFIFAPLGIEKFNLVEDFTAINHMDLYYYPYTHSLLGSFLWAGLIYGLWRYVPFFKNVGNHRVALVMAVAVVSHWVTDLLVHTPDLPLLGNDSLKVGFGLWNNFYATVILELSLLIGAVILYLRSTSPVGAMGKYAVIVFVGVMVAFYMFAITMPYDPNVTVTVASIMGLVIFTIFTAVAFWLDRYRT